jgi:hypothetical protein
MTDFASMTRTQLLGWWLFLQTDAVPCEDITPEIFTRWIEDFNRAVQNQATLPSHEPIIQILETEFNK